MLGLGGNADFPQLVVHVGHVRRDALGDLSEVVILEFLALGGQGAEYGTAGELEVLALGEIFLVHQEVFLLGLV